MEILFRGFHKQADGPDVAIIDGVAERGRWFEGSLVKMGPVGYTHYYILPDYASAFYEIEVIPSTVGQYTGLTDKNGKKIFLGDRVKVPMYRPDRVDPIIMDGTIVFGKAAFDVVWDEEMYGKHFARYLEGIEVTGTIYDAPPEGELNV